MTDQPQQRTVHVNGIDLCCFEWGQRGAPTLLLAHATGFHARVWDQVIAALPAPWRDAHIVALDARGHGRSAKQAPYDWRTCGEDLVAAIDVLELDEIRAVGHSFGGHLLVLAAAARPERFERLVLIDPVIPPPPAAPRADGPMFDPQSHPVARRRNVWDSWQQMFAHFEGRSPYDLWHREVLADYCRYGLIPSGDGTGLVLACPPLVEATFYSHSPFTSSHVHGLLDAVRQPVLVVRAQRRTDGVREQMDFANSPTWPALALALPHGTDLYLPQLTHFIPMQDPALTARLIADPDKACASQDNAPPSPEGAAGRRT
jgi:lipase